MSTVGADEDNALVFNTGNNTATLKVGGGDLIH